MGKRLHQSSAQVHNTLGYGFLEKVYQRALQIELIKGGSSAETETSIKVLYKNAVVGEYYADLLV
jgi:GxxExxY protein